MKATVLMYTALLLIVTAIGMCASNDTGGCEEGWSNEGTHCSRWLDPEEKCDGDEELTGKIMNRDGSKATDLTERRCIKYKKDDIDPNLVDVDFNSEREEKNI